MRQRDIRDEAGNNGQTIIWRRRLVSAGLVFFLVKGLLWLSLPGILLWWGSGS